MCAYSHVRMHKQRGGTWRAPRWQVAHYEAAAALQQRALDIDHQLFDNMSRRVAAATEALAETRHMQGRNDDAMSMLYLALGIYKQLAKGGAKEAELDGAETLVRIATVAQHTGKLPVRSAGKVTRSLPREHTSIFACVCVGCGAGV